MAADPLDVEPIGTPLPQGGRVHTPEQREQIFARREKSVELYAHGYSYTQIAKAMDVSWKTSYNDVQVYLDRAAKYFNAPRMREQIANPIRTTIRKAESIYQKFGDRLDPDAVDAKFRSIAAIQRGAEALARLYGMSGEASMYMTKIGVSPGLVIATGDDKWARNLDPSKLTELRGKFLEFVEAAREPVAAEFTIEEPGDESHNGHSGPTETEPPPDLPRPPGAEEQSGPATSNGEHGE